MSHPGSSSGNIGNPSGSKRIHRARIEMSHRRASVDSMKTEFRNKFIERLKKTRSKSVDRFRNIVDDYGSTIEYSNISELRQALLADHEATALIDSAEVSALINEIESELQQVSLEKQEAQREKESSQETEEMIDRLMGSCQVCASESVDSVCSICKKDLNSEFK